MAAARKDVSFRESKAAKRRRLDEQTAKERLGRWIYTLIIYDFLEQRYRLCRGCDRVTVVEPDGVCCAFSAHFLVESFMRSSAFRNPLTNRNLFLPEVRRIANTTSVREVSALTHIAWLYSCDMRSAFAQDPSTLMEFCEAELGCLLDNTMEAAELGDSLSLLEAGDEYETYARSFRRRFPGRLGLVVKHHRSLYAARSHLFDERLAGEVKNLLSYAQTLASEDSPPPPVAPLNLQLLRYLNTTTVYRILRRRPRCLSGRFAGGSSPAWCEHK